MSGEGQIGELTIGAMRLRRIVESEGLLLSPSRSFPIASPAISPRTIGGPRRASWSLRSPLSRSHRTTGWLSVGAAL
jgi:hypothetical protein